MDDLNVSNALRHLQEMTTFFRVLGSFPRAGSLVGLENLGQRAAPLLQAKPPKRRIGVLGFGTFGQFIAAWRWAQKLFGVPKTTEHRGEMEL